MCAKKNLKSEEKMDGALGSWNFSYSDIWAET